MLERRTLLALAASLFVPAHAEAGQRCEGESCGEDDHYALDELSRNIPKSGRVLCPKLELVTHLGSALRYDSPTKVHPAFRERLIAFEEVVASEARRHFGRDPRRIVHLGTYNCRRIGGYPELVSEHGLGNAIDVAGFDFAAPRGSHVTGGWPRQHNGAFSVRLDRHWKLDPRVSRESRFLRALAQRLIDRRDIFRVLLGPSYPGHHNHFHFDCAPYRLIDVFDVNARW